jgi:L-fuconolactonase
MSVIDSHHHVWWAGKHRHQWPPKAAEAMNRDFTPDDLRAELAACGIDGTVLVQVLQLEETRECLDVAREHAFIRGVVGWLPLVDTNATAAALEELLPSGKLVGVRHLISNEDDPTWLLQPNVVASLGLVNAARIAFDAIPVNAAQMESVLELAHRLPDLRIVVNHLAQPPVPEEGWDPWAAQIARAAWHPNVSMKLSAGLALVLKWRWSTDELRRYSDHVLQCFGPDRVMAGSNWPPVLLAGSYQEVWIGIKVLIAGLSEDERADVLGGTAARVYRLPPMGTA